VAVYKGWATIDHHVTTCDFPETQAKWLDLGRQAGFSGARELFQDPASGGLLSDGALRSVKPRYAGNLIRRAGRLAGTLLQDIAAAH
jgi:hypothetical protein